MEPLAGLWPRRRQVRASSTTGMQECLAKDGHDQYIGELIVPYTILGGYIMTRPRLKGIPRARWLLYEPHAKAP